MNNFKILLLTALFIILQSCGNKKSDTTKIKKEISTKSSIKKRPETNKKTTVIVNATIDDKNFVFGEVDTKYSGAVTLLKNNFRFKFVDTNGSLIMVSLNDSNVYKTPNSFSLQKISLPPKEQANVKVKSSKLVLKFPNKDKSMWSYNTELYEGVVQLKEFTEDKISIHFKGKAYPYGGNNTKGKLRPVEGKIILENYNVYDSR